MDGNERNVNEPLTDPEKRIFLAAMRRELDVCRAVDMELPGGRILWQICRNVEYKVKRSDLWREVKDGKGCTD